MEIDEVAEAIKKNVSIKDRRHHLSVFKDCFIAEEAVNWMVSNGVAKTRKDAVTLGLDMQKKGVLEHCLRDHQ